MHSSVLAWAKQHPARPPAGTVSRIPSQPSYSTAPSLLLICEHSPGHLVSEVGESEMGPLGEIVQLSSFTFLPIYNAAFVLLQFSIPEILWFMQPNFFDLNQLSQKLSRCFADCEWELQQTSSRVGRASFSKLWQQGLLLQPLLGRLPVCLIGNT